MHFGKAGVIAALWLGAAALHAQTTPVGPRPQTPGPFDAIEISGAADVRFTQGEVDQVIVEGDEDAQQAVSLSLSNNRLTVNHSGSWKFWNVKRRAVLHITARELKRVTISGMADFSASDPVQVGKLTVDISGAGQARFDQLKGEELRFVVSGSGDGRVAGQVSKLDLSISGRSDFIGDNLLTQNARVAVSGVGNAKVWVMQDLSLSISGIGTIDHWGTATVKRSVSGIGKVNDRGPKRASTPER
jgi:Putative auto-transporter adhesin, head GIN domain